MNECHFLVVWGGLKYGHHLALLHLAANLPHVGVDVARLACHLHRPMNCDHQAS
jgi:hypothetical protein